MKVSELIRLLQNEEQNADVVARMDANDSEAPVDGVTRGDDIHEIYINVGLW